MANEVGRVHVRVLPDTTGFATRTRQKLKALKEQKYKVPVDIDEDKFQAQLKGMIARTNLMLAREKNHIRFHAELATTKKAARAQALEQRTMYQAMADDQRAVKFDAELDKKSLTADVPVRHSIDSETFTRDLTRAVKRATSRVDISVWGDRKTVERQADRAASIFRERLEYINRDTTVFGDTAKIDEQAKKVARSTRERLREALKDFNVFGAPKDIEDQTSDAIDVFKRKWREAQGEFNIRANLEADTQKFQDLIDDVDDMRVAVEKGTTALSDHERQWRDVQEQISHNARQAAKYRGKLDGLQLWDPKQYRQWWEASIRVREHREEYERLVEVAKDLGHKLRHTKLEVELDHGDLVEAEANLDRWRQRIEMQALEIDTDIKTAASEAALALLTRPRVVEIRTRMAGQARRALQQMSNISGANWSSIGRVISGFATRSTGLRLLWQTARDIVDIIPRMDMMIPQLAQGAAVAATAVAGIGTLLASIVSIGADMLKAFQTALIAPAMLAGLVTVGAVLYSAFRDLNKELPHVQKGFLELRDIASSSFWSRGRSQIGAFFDTLLGSLRQWTPSVSRRVAAATGALADGLREGLATHADRFFENLNRGLKGAEGGFKALGSALMGLIGAGSDSFESLGRWFTGVMQDFDSWVKRNDANGNITRWINEGAQAIRDIGSLIYSTGSMLRTFGNLVQEAGGPSLSDFAAGMREVREAMKGDGFRNLALPPLEAAFRFMSAFGAIKPQAAQAVATALELITFSLNRLSGPLTTAFGAILTGFSDPTFTTGFRKFINGMGDFITDISPGLELLTRELGAMFGIVGTGASAFGPAFNEMLTLVGDLGHGLHEGLEDFLKFFGPELESLVQSIGPGLREMADAVGSLLSNKGFQGFLSNINSKFQEMIPLVTDVGVAIVELIESIFEKYTNLPPWMQDLIGWTVALGGAGLFAAPLIKPLLKPLTALLGIFKTPLKNLAREGLLGAVDRLSRVNWGAISRGASRVAAPLAGVFAALTIPLGAGWSWSEKIADWLGLDGLADFSREVKSRIDSATGGRSLAGIAWDTIKEVFGELKTGDIIGAVRAFAGGVGTAFEGVLNSVTSPITTLADKILEWLGLEDMPGHKLMQEYGYDGTIRGMFESIWTLIRTPLNESWDKLMGYFRDWQPTTGLGQAVKYIYEKIPGLLGFDGEGNWSWGTLTSSWKSFAPDAWGAIKTWLGNQWTSLNQSFTNWEPPADNETAVLVKKVLTAVRELAGFDESGNWSWSNLTSTWKSFASDAWSSIGSWLDEQISELWGKISSWAPVAKAIDMVKKVADWVAELFGYEDFDDAWTSITDWWEELRDSVDECLDRAWEGFKDWLEDWSPVLGAGGGVGPAAKIGEWVAELLGIDEGWAWDCGDLAKFWDTAWTGFKKWAQEKWDDLVGKLEEWEPTNPAFEIGRWLGELLRKLFGKDEEPEDNGQVDWWPAVKAWLKAKWDKLVEDIQSWEPTNPAIGIGLLLWKWLKGIFGKKEEPEDNGQVNWWDSVKAWLKGKWDKLVEDIRSWEPASPAASVGELLWKWLKGIFGKDEEPQDGGQVSWWASVKAWLQGKWDELVENIRGWTPINPGFSFGRWLGEKIRGLFGGGSSGDPEEDQPLINWDYWLGKIKHILTVGVVGIIAAITSPLWIIAAPIALGAWVVSKIFGNVEDEDGDGSIVDEVRERVERFLGPIIEGLTGGIEAIGRGIGEIIHEVICLPQYILDEIFTDCFGEEGMSTRVAERVGRWAGPMLGGLASGIAGIRGQLNGYTATAGGNGGPGNGLLDRLIGTTPAHVDGTVGNLARLGAGIATFGTGVVGEFANMGGGTRREIAGLTDNTEAEFGTMSSKSQGDARSMNSGVVGQFSAMATRAIAQAVRLQGSAQRAMAQANVQMVAQGRAANAGFVAQMTAMAARSISVANGLRGGLQSALRINASGSGSYTGGTFVSGLRSGLSRAVGVARSMAGTIRGALSFSAYSSGSTVGGTFASGISARIGSVASAASRLARAARSRLPNSPADEGPFSGSGWGGWGESIAEEMAKGLRKAAPEVAREAERLMGGVHGALDSRSDLAVGVDFERNRKRHLLSHEAEGAGARTTNVNVNVESRSEDPLQDGNRFGGDIAFALRGAGLA